MNITKATAEIAKAIHPRGFVSNVTVKARKAIIAVRIIFGIARKPFLNAFKPLIKLAGKLFIEVIAHSFKAIDDFKILLGNCAKEVFKLLLILLISATTPLFNPKFDISKPSGFPNCAIFLP